MTYHPVVDQFSIPIPLDPWSAAVFAAVFVAAAVLTSKRATYGACALLAATPFAFAREVLGTSVTLPKAVLLGVLVGLLSYAGCARLLRDRPAALLLGALGFYLVATLIAVPGAEHAGAALREAFKVAQYLLTFAAAYLCYRLDPDDSPLLAAACLTAIAVSLSALAQEFVGAPSGLYVGKAIIPRVAGVLEGPNQLAGYFQSAIAILAAWALVRRSALLDAALALSTCADVLTFSRSGWLGLAAVVAVLAIVAGRPVVRALRPAIGGAVAGLLVVGFWAFYAQSLNVLRASLEESAYAGGVGNRSELWGAAWRMFLAHPLRGVGGGNYELELAEYGVYGVRTHANSWFLQSLAEGGVALFAATLAVVAASIGAFVRNLRGASPWVLAAFAASVALALHQIADYLVFYPKVGGEWWLLLGIGAAASCSRAPQA